MGEGIESVNRTFYDILIHRNEVLRDIIDAADGRDDPDFISNAYTSVLTNVAFKRFCRHCALLGYGRLIGVFDFTAKVCLHIVGVYPVARRDVFRGMADGNTVFDHLSVYRDIPDRDFVALRDVLLCGDIDVIDGNRVSLLIGEMATTTLSSGFICTTCALLIIFRPISNFQMYLNQTCGRTD